MQEMELNKSAGILDDFAVRKNIATREGTIEKVPVNDSDIVNKKYVDSHNTWETINVGTLDENTYPDPPSVTALSQINLFGADVFGSTSDNNAGISLFLGYNNSETQNRQLWIGNPEHIGDSTKSIFRYWFYGGMPCVSGVNGTNALNKSISVGYGAPLLLGALGSDGSGADIQMSGSQSWDGNYVITTNSNEIVFTPTFTYESNVGTYIRIAGEVNDGIIAWIDSQDKFRVVDVIQFAGGTQSADGSAGITATITTARLTPVTGTQGSMTFKNGLLTAQTQAT